MQKQRLQEIILDQRQYFFTEKELIPRDLPIERSIKSKQIVVISGIRRCGKSSLLYLISKKMDLPNRNCLYFNFDDERLQNFTSDDFNLIYQLHIELFLPENPQDIVFFLDEIQNVKHWERFLSRMYERGSKIFITGSNALLLSSEIATALTGRNLTLNLQPFSFNEFLRYNNKEPENLQLTTQQQAQLISKFNDYFKWGGFPLMDAEKDPAIIKNYYQDILYRDIIARFHITQIEEIKELALYLFSNVGKLFSLKILQNITGIKSNSSIKRYLDYFAGSFLFDYLKKYDYSIKKQILNPRKSFVCDIAFSHYLGFRFSEDRGRLLENLVFIELKRRTDKANIYYHKGEKECDFIIVENRTVTQAIQVTQIMDNAITRNREIDGLKDALCTYSLTTGLILTESEEAIIEEDSYSIQIQPIWKWLIE